MVGRIEKIDRWTGKNGRIGWKKKIYEKNICLDGQKKQMDGWKER